MSYSVWAPYATTVELMLWRQTSSLQVQVQAQVQVQESDARRIALRSGKSGWFHADDLEWEEGDRYAFSLDGGIPLPDPRSRSQPDGVHAPSAWVDEGALRGGHDDFRQVPLTSAVLYELHIGTFTEAGTFDAAIDRLDHLVKLGVTHVELMPVAAFPGERGWGYDGVGLFAPHAAYGGPHGLARLVAACHARGLAVILDVVYNHLGPSGNYLGKFGPYFSQRYQTPWGDAVNVDGSGSDPVRRFICDNAISWMRDYGIDGLRLDAVHEIYDCSAHHVLAQLAEEVDTLSGELEKPLVLIAESASNDPRNVRSRELGGHGLSSQWSDDFHHAIHAALSGEQVGYYEDFGSVRDVAEALRHGFVYRGQYSAHRDYSFGHSTEGLWRRRFVVFSQNHDQVGNRAVGERLSQLVSPGRLRIAAALTILGPYVPLLFMGEEWGTRRPFQYFTDHAEPELAKAVSKGRKREFSTFGWTGEVPDPQDEETFVRSKLDWNELSQAEHAALLSDYRQLIELRRRESDLTDDHPDKTSVTYHETDRWVAFRRGAFVTVCHWGTAAVTLDAQDVLERLAALAATPGSAGAAKRTLRAVLALPSSAELQGTEVTLPPDSVFVFQVEPQN